MIQRYRVLGRSVPEGDELQQLLPQAYAARERAHCACRREEDLPLYIARWPDSGARHATGCDHYEAPDFLTGMGQVRGAAASCKATQEALPQMLFVPESFKLEEKADIRARRRAALARVCAPRDEMMVVVGEIKEIV